MMASTHPLYLLMCFKALADDTRFKMLGMLMEREYTVHELAGALELSDPTVSHHLSKLRGVNLVTLRMDGNQHFYSVPNLNRLKQAVNQIETLMAFQPEENDVQWIDALPFDDAEKKIIRDYTFAGRLKQIPKFNKLMPVLKWLALQFEQGVIYSEKDVNDIILKFHNDYATLRRHLVDHGFLRRERAGTKYWLTPENETINMPDAK